MQAVATDNLNIRAKPSVDSMRLGGITKGALINVGTTQEGNYYPILNTTSAYVLAEFVSFDVNVLTNPVTQPHIVQAVATDVLNIRQYPDKTSKLLGQVKTGENVTADFNVWDNGYTAITMPQKGYVLRSFLHDTSSSGTNTPIPPVTPQKTPFTYGLHVEATLIDNGLKQLIIDMATRLHKANRPLASVVVIDNVDMANQLAKVVKTVIFRSYPNGQHFNPSKLTDETSARQHGNEIYNDHLGVISQLDRAIYVQFRNENSEFPNDNYFDLQIMANCDRDGFKAAIFGDSVGTPNVDQWQTRQGALAYAMTKNHIVVIHEYGAFVNGKPGNVPVSDPATRQWYGTRHEMLYNSVSENCRPLMIVGEWGTSDAYPHGQATIDDMKNYNALLQNDPYVIGFCLWGMGASQYNANGLLPAIENMIMA
jgi:hypothetical protein